MSRWFLNETEKKNALSHATNCTTWVEAIKKECLQEPTSTCYILEKVEQAMRPLEAIRYICELAQKEDDEQ